MCQERRRRIKRRKRRSWVELLVEEILRLGDMDSPPPLDERRARKFLARIERLADAGWSKAFPRSQLERGSEPSAVERLRALHSLAVYLAERLRSDKVIAGLPKITLTVNQAAWRGIVARTLQVEGDLLQSKVSVAVLEALRQDPEMRFLRCPVCGLLTVVIRRGQKYCSSRCSRVAVDRRRNKQEKRRIYLTMVSYAKKRGVPIEQVRVRKVKGRWRCYLAPPKDLRTIR